MDTAMRDLERIEERSSEEGRGVLVLSGVGLVAAIAVVVGAVAALPDGSHSQPEDPLQMLVIANEVEGEEPAKEPAADPSIDPETLSFPTTLVTETRPEVAAAMAAWLPIVPEVTKRAASLPVSSAATSCSRLTVGSSP